jgi:hypothetical protein
MAAMRYYGNVMTSHVIAVFYIFNSTVVDWTCCCVFFVITFKQLLLFYKYWKKFGTRNFRIYLGRDTCGILSLWVIFEVLIAVSVKGAVVLVVTPCGLIEVYNPFFFYQEVRGDNLLHLYGGNRTHLLPPKLCKFLPDFISRKMKFLKNWGHV